jgi:hypothetical protein
MAKLPSSYLKYIKFCDEHGLPRDERVTAFAARYKLAASFEGVNFSGYSPNTSEAYAVGMKIALAYSALDQLESAILEKDHPEIYFEDATKFLVSPRYEMLRQFLHSQIDKKYRQEQFISYIENSGSNIRPFLEQIRHSVFHGSWNAGATGLGDAPAKRAELFELADEILAFANNQFSGWMSVFSKQ